uniref:AT-rich interactive domain-containing protein 5B n=1 Tax=Oncorhynchus mykiss TaxID=8022 RepID=A0A8K9XZ88_ONCMY
MNDLSLFPQWLGSPCGFHGPYIFYKAFRFDIEANPRILSLGDFFLVRCRPGEPLCIAELQLLWEERSRKQLLSSSKLYFLPEDTPQGRTVSHGEDEVLAVSEKVVVKLQDLVRWTVWDSSGWSRGLKAAPLKPSEVLQELEKNGQRDTPVLHRYRESTLNSGLNFKYVLKEKTQLGDDGDQKRVSVLSYPQYCRYRSLLARLKERPASLLTSQVVLALGGVTSLTDHTHILYCRDTFEHPTLIDNDNVCDEFAPNLKGRPRKKKLSFSQRCDSQNTPAGKETCNTEGKAPAKVKPESKAVLSRWPKGISRGSNCCKRVSPKGRTGGGGEECPPDEQAFLVALYKYMKERRTPIERIPYLGFKQINLWNMFQAAETLGGYELITSRRQWKHVYDELGGNPGSTSAATCTRRHYERLILPYERFTKGEEDKPLPLSKPRKDLTTQQEVPKTKVPTVTQWPKEEQHPQNPQPPRTEQDPCAKGLELSPECEEKESSPEEEGVQVKQEVPLPAGEVSRSTSEEEEEEPVAVCIKERVLHQGVSWENIKKPPSDTTTLHFFPVDTPTPINHSHPQDQWQKELPDSANPCPQARLDQSGLTEEPQGPNPGMVGIVGVVLPIRQRSLQSPRAPEDTTDRAQLPGQDHSCYRYSTILYPGRAHPGPGINHPGTNHPGTNPGINHPGTNHPGTNPGINHPGTNHPGTNPGINHPGTNPGINHPGTNPGINHPGTNPGINHPGTNPGINHPGTNSGTNHPGTNPGTNHRGTNHRGTNHRGINHPGTNSGTNHPGTNPGTNHPGTNHPGTNHPGTNPGTNSGTNHPGTMSDLAKKKLLSQVNGTAPGPSLPNHYAIGPPPPLINTSLAIGNAEESACQPIAGCQGSCSTDTAVVKRPSVIQHAQSFKPLFCETGERREREGLNRNMYKPGEPYSPCDLTQHHPLSHPPPQTRHHPQPHPNSPCDLTQLHPNSPYDLTHPHPNSTYDLTQPHPNSTDDLTQPHPNSTYDLTQPHPNSTYDLTQPHPKPPCDLTQPHPNSPCDLTQPHPNSPYDLTQPHPNSTYDLYLRSPETPQPGHITRFLPDFSPPLHPQNLHSLYNHTETHVSQFISSRERETPLPRDCEAAPGPGGPQFPSSKHPDTVSLGGYCARINLLTPNLTPHTLRDMTSLVQTSSEDQPTDLSLPKSSPHKPTLSTATPSLHNNPHPLMPLQDTGRFCRVPPMTMSSSPRQPADPQPNPRGKTLNGQRGGWEDQGLGHKIEELNRPILGTKNTSRPQNNVCTALPLKRSLEERENGPPERKIRAVTPMHSSSSSSSCTIRDRDREGHSEWKVWTPALEGVVPADPQPAPAHSLHLHITSFVEGHKFPFHSSPLFPGGLYPEAFISQIQDMCEGHRPLGYHPLQYLKNQAGLSPLVPPFAFHSFMMQRQAHSPAHMYRHPMGASYGELLHHGLHPMSSMSALNTQQHPDISPSQLSSVHPNTKRS